MKSETWFNKELKKYWIPIVLIAILIVLPFILFALRFSEYSWASTVEDYNNSLGVFASYFGILLGVINILVVIWLGVIVHNNQQNYSILIYQTDNDKEKINKLDLEIKQIKSGIINDSKNNKLDKVKLSHYTHRMIRFYDKLLDFKPFNSKVKTFQQFNKFKIKEELVDLEQAALSNAMNLKFEANGKKIEGSDLSILIKAKLRNKYLEAEKYLDYLSESISKSI